MTIIRPQGSFTRFLCFPWNGGIILGSLYQKAGSTCFPRRPSARTVRGCSLDTGVRLGFEKCTYNQCFYKCHVWGGMEGQAKNRADKPNLQMSWLDNRPRQAGTFKVRPTQIQDFSPKRMKGFRGWRCESNSKFWIHTISWKISLLHKWYTSW